jgi:hypothetical protein
MNIIPANEYNAHPGITKSAICSARVETDVFSMAAMRASMTADREANESTPAQRWGTLAHAALLEPTELARRVAVWDGESRRGKEYLAFKADAEARGLEIVTRGELDKLSAMCAAIRADKDARWIVGQCVHTEQAIEWQDADYGLAKGRLDGCGAGMILEYKTARNVGKRAFFNAAEASGYSLGVAWYWHGYGRPGAVYVIAQQNVQPYSVVSYIVPVGILESAYEEARQIAVRYRIAERAGEFPGPYSGIQTFERPAWVAGNGEIDVSTGTEEGGLMA